jgi:virginiamycin B lyase
MLRSLAVALSVLALAAAGSASASAALTPTITTYPSSNPVSASSHPYAIAAGHDGALWFTDPYAPKIGRIATDGTLTLQVPASAFQYGITAGSDGAMWFVSQAPSTVNRIDGSGAVLSKPLASTTANPTHIVSGPGGALWFTESVTKAIGRIPAATPLATPDESRLTSDGPNAIASGSDGNLWYTEYSSSVIGRMTPAGVKTDFPLPSGILNPEGIAAGPDGALWYTALNPPTVTRIATDGTQTPHPLPAGLYPNEIAAGADGALWFAGPDIIARITTAGAVEKFPLPAGVGLNYVAAGPDGNVWFTEENAGMIGRITTQPNATTGAASVLGSGAANVAGVVNGHAQPTSYRVEYGTSTSYGASSSSGDAGTGSTDVPATAKLSGLQPNTTYHYRLDATNPTGTAVDADATFTTLALPVVGAVRVDPKTWRRGSKLVQISSKKRRQHVGTRISFSLSRAVPVDLKFFAKQSGRKVGRKCRRPTPKNHKAKKCVRLRLAGSISLVGHSGDNTVRFQGRISKSKKLKPGRYQLKVTATDATSPATPSSRTASLTIVRR